MILYVSENGTRVGYELQAKTARPVTSYIPRDVAVSPSALWRMIFLSRTNKSALTYPENAVL
jgi:hypothetical protein